MKNDYIVRDDEIIIYLARRRGHILETKVSERHLPELISSPFRFFASWDARAKRFYVVYHTIVDGKYTIRSLHRFVSNCPDDKVVDHWDKDTLNNLDDNLKVVTHCENSQNRNGLHPTNTTGFKGVSYNARTRKYVAQIRINKKHTFIGYFRTPEEAQREYFKFRDSQQIHLNTEVI